MVLYSSRIKLETKQHLKHSKAHYNTLDYEKASFGISWFFLRLTSTVFKLTYGAIIHHFYTLPIMTHILGSI